MQATGKIRKYSLYVESLTIMNIPVCWGLFILDCPSYRYDRLVSDSSQYKIGDAEKSCSRTEAEKLL